MVEVRGDWTANEILQEIKSRYWQFRIPPGWDDDRLCCEIKSCGSKPEPKPAPKAAAERLPYWLHGVPAGLRDRIASTTIPEDRDANFREIVCALADCGLDTWRSRSRSSARRGCPYSTPETAAGISRTGSTWRSRCGAGLSAAAST